MYAKVIVDVPAKDTNRAFDYIIPPSLEPWVEVGSRVGVPFGSRVIQGFVVELRESSDYELHKMREIKHVLDPIPPLNGELVELSRWMSRKYACHEITALQAMIPGALKAKYERKIIVSGPKAQPPVEDDREREIIDYILSKESLSMEQLLRRFPADGPLLKEMLIRGRLAEEQEIKDRLSKKTVLTVFPPENPQLLEACLAQLPENAKRQRQLIEHLQTNPEPVKLADLSKRQGISSSAVKALADKGWIALREVEVFRDPYENRVFERTTSLQLTDEQQAIYDEIAASLRMRTHQVFLLHGVTGSGKTEVYLQAIEVCLNQGREAIVLVPEISLTPQMVERFKSRFGDWVAVLHSRLSHGERYDEWRKIQMGKVKVAIGARSAVFAPFSNLGLLIVDEEHEASYKQEENPKYHAGEVAVARGRQSRAVILLGSATPSLESYHRTQTGEYKLLKMPSRVQGRPLPAVQVIDMREELKAGNRSMFSRALHQAIEDRLQKQEQMVLLLNRRGYSTFVMCRSCGYVAGCPHCEISLTYHHNSRTMRCHYCGYAERELNSCPSCKSAHIRFFGAGTQRVEEELVRLFPGIRVIRMDVDTTNQKGAHEKWLQLFRSRQADVLLGTQMVAKGLDFPYVTLVGVIAADTVLNLPDFRSAEKTFQLLTQVAGRAGRHHLPGEVVIQSYTPEHYSIQCASMHDYSRFVAQELKLREAREYPPFWKLILVTLSHGQIPLLVRAGETLADEIRQQWRRLSRHATDAGGDGRLEVLGPVASPISRIKDRYRFQCMIKYRGDVAISGIMDGALSRLEDTVSKEKLQISVDVDPQMMM
ncbi:primosomal protein N' [Ferviditalea candida]|uniref:Replication restart protein PriA n=1 Tax=Ferviditalea candida TaxID=3108399 RepID=A0ABU5ZIU1_9BACL|nr:primosomal protein N' [Paenibacillaceae bacterium T2]